MIRKILRFIINHSKKQKSIENDIVIDVDYNDQLKIYSDWDAEFSNYTNLCEAFLNSYIC